MNKLPYNPLSPTVNAENIEHYSQALNWALENRKDIKNIALTGPYGSGKSSFLKSFQNTNNNNKFVFLNISLSTFTKEKRSKNENDNQLRLIELSILQQIFYHVDDKKIPYSRLKKIKNYSNWFLGLLPFGFVSVVILPARFVHETPSGETAK